jgi:hypothetical protein
MMEGELLTCSNIPLINIEIVLALLFFLWLLIRLMYAGRGGRENVEIQELGNSEKS